VFGVSKKKNKNKKKTGFFSAIEMAEPVKASVSSEQLKKWAILDAEEEANEIAHKMKRETTRRFIHDYLKDTPKNDLVDMVSSIIEELLQEKSDLCEDMNSYDTSVRNFKVKLMEFKRN